MFPPFQLPGPLHWMKQLLGGSPLAAIGGGSGERLWAIVLGGLLAVVAISLLIASWTKWGQTKSLSKCIALAFLAHIWLLVYAYGTRIITPGSGDGSGGGAATPGVVSIQMSSGEETSHLPPASLLDSRLAAMDSQDELERSEREEPQNDALLNAPVDQQQTDGSTESKNAKAELDAWEKPLDLPSESLSHRLADIPMDEILQEPVAAQSEPIDAPTPVLAPAMVPAVSPDLAEFEALLARAVPPSLPPPPPQSQPSHSQPSYLPPPPLANLPIASSMSNPSVSNRSVPPAARADTQSTYQNRFATNRMEIVRAGGGDENTEASVELALKWLARAQSPNGSWYAAAFGAGSPSMINRPGPDGEYRQNAGIKANTAMTGLALLAFLGAGHHHQDGRYANTVQQALQYLIDEQLPSGDMSGREQVGREDAVRFARMYSHGMASLAVAEAYAITRDPRLLPVVQAACQYSLRAMNPRSGGWRYEYPTDDPGDTSQFGWQALLLHSASNAGASSLSGEQRSKMERFLNSVSVGRSGGLATYRPSRGGAGADQATPSMTAEALASRLFLGLQTATPAITEAQQYLLRSPPGREQDNFYYWYYATMALYQARAIYQNTPQADHHNQVWQRWNSALKKHLCSTQVAAGPNRGSWNPTCVWGNYGGRVYTTALGALSLEVYYRYLPILQPQMANAAWAPYDPSLR